MGPGLRRDDRKWRQEAERQDRRVAPPGRGSRDVRALVVSVSTRAATGVYDDRTGPVIVASQFGNTTPCITHARGLLEAAGFEVMVFAATGKDLKPIGFSG